MTTFTGQPPLTDEADQDLFGDLTPDTQETPEEPEESDVEQPVEPSEEEVPPPSAEPAAPEGTEGEVESEAAAETTSEAPTSETEEVEEPKVDVDWKKRYDDIRSSQMASLEQERSRAELAEQMLASKLAEMESAKISPDKLAELTKRAEEQGLDPASVGLYADITSEAVDARTRIYQEALQQQAQADQRAVEERQAAAERALVADFIEAHQELPEEKRPEMAKVLHDIGAAYFVDQNGNELPENQPYDQKLAVGHLKTYEPLTPEILEIAFEAVTNDGLGTVLRAMPTLYESDEGMQMARRLASAPELTTQPAPPKAPRDVDKALKDAETLGGPSAPAPPAEEDFFVKPSAEIHFSK